VRRNERSEEARKDRGVTEEVSTETIAGQVVEPKKKDG
jgi:hypothetical protein